MEKLIKKEASIGMEIKTVRVFQKVRGLCDRISPLSIIVDVRPTTTVLPALLQLQQYLPRNFFQGLEDAVALERDGFHYGLVFATKFFAQSID